MPSSSFFTAPASQRKRKRRNDEADQASSAPQKRRNTAKSTGGLKTSGEKAGRDRQRRGRRDESISSGGSEEDEEAVGKGGSESGESEEDNDDDNEKETGAERRLRLAEQYLQRIKGEVDEVGFDAEEIDKDLIAERLQEDVAETKGRLYRHIASTFDFSSATCTSFRTPCVSTTSVATCASFAYTVHKDLTLIKWELPTPTSPLLSNPTSKPQRPVRRRPIKLKTVRGDRSKAGDPNYQHHTASILCVAASDTGKYVATGGADKRLIIWSADNLAPLRVFTQHRDAVTSLAFRRGTNQLYSCSSDRTVKIWDELVYVETLFGHQDQVVDLASLALERCVSVGARDRTARLWKVVDQTQLVFRGGGTSEKRRPPPRHEQDDDENRRRGSEMNPKSQHRHQYYGEGSIDRVALVDEETFVTGSDNGSICLWTLHKKKPIFTVPLAHGLDPALKPEEASAEADATAIKRAVVPARQPRWITALATIPYSDVVLSGSWDGRVRVWRVSSDKKRLESMGWIGGEDRGDEEVEEHHHDDDGNDDEGDDEKIQKPNGRALPPQETKERDERLTKPLRGIINDLSILELESQPQTAAHHPPPLNSSGPPDKGRDQGQKERNHHHSGRCILVVAALGTEHRLGRWKKVGAGGGVSSNRPVLFEVWTKSKSDKGVDVEGEEEVDERKEKKGGVLDG